MTRQRAADRRAQRGGRNQAKPARKARGSNGRVQRGKFHEFTVVKPFCSPCRAVLQELSERFEIPLYEHREGVSMISIKNLAKRIRIELKTFENLRYGPAAPGFLPMSNWAKFKVPMARARWFEDIINYDGRLFVQKGSLDSGSYSRGKRGTISHAWKEQEGYGGPVDSGGIRSVKFAGMVIGQEPVIEKGCKSGKDLWDQVERIKKKVKK